MSIIFKATFLFSISGVCPNYVLKGLYNVSLKLLFNAINMAKVVIKMISNINHPSVVVKLKNIVVVL
jgi:hypothetical protein